MDPETLANLIIVILAILVVLWLRWVNRSLRP